MTNLAKIKFRVERAISPLKPADASTPAPKDFLFSSKRTQAGRNLPPYYLVYFLLVDLLGFPNIGQFEKVAWSVPVEFDGRAFLIEHRKFGIGIFADDLPSDEYAAAEILRLIQKGTKAAQPYFDWRAEQAAKDSHLNVVNRSRELFERLSFFLQLYDERHDEAERRKDETVKTQIGEGAFSYSFPAIKLRSEAEWFALSAIEAFFAWTEHVFIHVAILAGKCKTGEDVAQLASCEWNAKFKTALDLGEPATKTIYDQLTILRRQLRNFVAHGAFGKDGEAFSFHSGVGAVPMLLPHRKDRAAFHFGQGVDLKPEPAIELIRRFIDHLWAGPRDAARIYVQDYGLPLILTNVANGEYASAMTSSEAMEEYAHYLAELMDRYANMDF